MLADRLGKLRISYNGNKDRRGVNGRNLLVFFKHPRDMYQEDLPLQVQCVVDAMLRFHQ
jgi:hypothetical protein